MTGAHGMEQVMEQVPGVSVILMPWWIAAAALGIFALLFCLITLFVLKRVRPAGGELHMPAQIPIGSQVKVRGWPLSGWDARVKIAALLFFMFSAAFLRSVPSALTALVFSLALAIFCRVGLYRILVRISAVSMFLLLILVVLPFSTAPAPGDTVLGIEGLAPFLFNVRGLRDAAVIIMKACAIVMLMEPLFYSSPLSEFSNALISLRIPPKAVYILNLATRYLNVMAAEASSMLWALRSRAFRPSATISGLRTLAGLFAILFIRSYERTQRLQEAMALRGFHGEFPRGRLGRIGAADIVKAALFIAAGLCLHLMDVVWR